VISVDFRYPPQTGALVLEFNATTGTQFVFCDGIDGAVGDLSIKLNTFFILPAGFDASEWTSAPYTYCPVIFVTGWDDTQWGDGTFIAYRNRTLYMLGMEHAEYGTPVVRRNEIDAFGTSMTEWGDTLIGNELQILRGLSVGFTQLMDYTGLSSEVNVHSNKIPLGCGDQLNVGRPGVWPYYIRPVGINALVINGTDQGWRPPNVTWIGYKNRTLAIRGFDALGFSQDDSRPINQKFRIDTNPHFILPTGIDSLQLTFHSANVGHKNVVHETSSTDTLECGFPMIYNKSEGRPCNFQSLLLA
jgi:hypothetical protein